MSLWQPYAATQLLETTENYARADLPLASPPEDLPGTNDRNDWIQGDEAFWNDIFVDPDRSWNSKYRFGHMAVSEWVARVPGLFWRPDVQRLRDFQHAAIELVGKWEAFSPLDKSAKVMSGIGTLRLPASDDGYHLVTLTGGLNVSAGIPALLSPEVWERIGSLGRHEGRVIYVAAGMTWQQMSIGWSMHFEMTRGLPRGYLHLRNPDAVQVVDEVAPTLIHPFSVMEYREQGKDLFGYVYATADTSESDYRDELEEFFLTYATANERYGHYLLAADAVVPMWDAAFVTPAQLRRTDQTGSSQLELLENRIRSTMLGDDTIECVLSALGKIDLTIVDVERISHDIGISPGVWSRGGQTLAKAKSLFVSEANRQEKLEQLIEVLARAYPAILTH